MTRTRILVAAGVTAIALTACGGVDREGTRDEIVKTLADSGIEIDGDCIDAALDKYSDDELEAMDQALQDDPSSDDAAALMEDILSCVPVGS